MPHDQLWKVVLSTFLADFMFLFFEDEARRLDFTTARFIDKEVFTDLPEGARREPDVLAEIDTVDGDAEVVLIHVEIQAQRDTDIPFRMWQYFSLLRLRLRKPVFPVVLYLTPGPGGVAEERYQEHVLGREVLSFRYAIATPPDMLAADYEERDIPLAPAIGALMRAPGADRALRKFRAIQRLMQAPVDDARRSLLVYLVNRYTPLDEREGLRFDRLMQESGLENAMSVINTWEDYLVQKGVAEGIERGIEQGIERGARQVLLRQLRAKFGDLPTSARDRLERVDDPAALEALSERILTAATLEEMRLDDLRIGKPS